MILMTYTVLGTLYNRYVLQLRGFEQLPQFSAESMRYHTNEAIDWLKDISAGLGAGHSRNGGRPFGATGSGEPTNPVSHHTQTTYGDEELGGGFLRQPQGRPSHPRMDTNPVSHHSQVHAEQQAQSLSMPPPIPHQAASPSPPQPPAKDHQTNRVDSQSAGPHGEGKEFMLGDDEGEETEEKSAGHSRQELSADLTAPRGLIASPKVSPSSDATALRGRDLGEGNVIRL